MTEQILRDRITGFINSTLLAPGRARVNADTELFEQGVLDSLQVLDLIAFVETETGRPLHDSVIRLANFRTATTIAATASGAGSTERPSRDRIWSRSRSRRGSASIAAMDLEDEMLQWGHELGAREVTPPRVIALSALERAGYLASFPGRAVPAPSGGGGTADDAIPPAACLRWYADLADRTLDASPTVLALRCRCARGDEQVNTAHGRLREFTMREIVVLGTGGEVDRARRAVMRRAQTYLTRLDLSATIEVASDPFHLPADRGKLALQRLRALKYELRMPMAGETIAVASFNYHEDYFGRAFDISLPDGSPAHSACVAFGLERWELALGEQGSADATALARTA